MKNYRGLRILTALLIMLMTGLTVQAQNQSSQEAQEKAQQEKEMQLKEMEMQLKKKQLEQEQKMVEAERTYARQREKESSVGRNRAVVYSRGTGINDEGSYLIQSYGQESQSQLTLRNSFSGETVNSSGEFEVDANTSHFRLTANGKVRHGEISLKVFYPGGKIFKDLTINSSAEISFSQSLTIKEEEKKKYIGTWKYEVKTKTAEGSYMLSIMTH
jgi:hypothetical protein